MKTHKQLLVQSSSSPDVRGTMSWWGLSLSPLPCLGQPPDLPGGGVLSVLTWGLRSVCSVCNVCSVCSCWAGWVVKAARQVSCGLNQRYSVGSVQLWHSPPAAAARWLLPMCVSWLCLPIENCFNWLISSWVRSDPTDCEWWSQSGRARSCGCPA